MKENKNTSLIESINPLRNYLILIFAFAALICLSIVFLLAIIGPTLEPMQTWVLIAFLAGFSILSLGVIAWLVLRHAKVLSIASNDQSIGWENVSPESQKKALNEEVDELASIMNVPVEQLNDLRSAYIVAEDLALRKIQQEANRPLLRHVSLNKVGFNALNIEDDLVTCVQVCFVASEDIRQEKINTVLRRLSKAKAALSDIRKGSKIRLLLVLVTQLDQEAESKLRASLVSKFSSTPVNVDIRLLDFQSLQRTYAEQ